MKDEQLRILVLTKLYEYNRNHYTTSHFKSDKIFEGGEPNQLNFCFQYLGTLGLIENSTSVTGGVYDFNPKIITGKGIDIVESLMLKITTTMKNKLFEEASSVIEKIPIFLAEALVNQDIWDTLIKIFNELIKALMVIF